ncbi:extracellular endo-1,4-beta-xylanase [Zalerion maritima]|uniref:Extracellular endo-1,4-beta-xylanase n=1 Tax=Zalerion maritima TaxID=339359 RepID=A0AAD5RSH3_9PEZI|nr:extracellular endo-1,4-beta-xylanase [Zalerion maritima]
MASLSKGISKAARAARQRAFPDLFASVEVIREVAITELNAANAPANDYAAVSQACLEVDTCVGFTVWGVHDQDSWCSNTSPLLFSCNFQPKSGPLGHR